jgi:hypothetical protein
LVKSKEYFTCYVRIKTDLFITIFLLSQTNAIRFFFGIFSNVRAVCNVQITLFTALNTLIFNFFMIISMNMEARCFNGVIWYIAFDLWSLQTYHILIYSPGKVNEYNFKCTNVWKFICLFGFTSALESSQI